VVARKAAIDQPDGPHAAAKLDKSIVAGCVTGLVRKENPERINGKPEGEGVGCRYTLLAEKLSQLSLTVSMTTLVEVLAT
jgi:hypothetical protein